MIPLETVDHDTFVPLERHAFVALIGTAKVELRLHSIQKLGHKRSDAARDPFSITFRGPQGLRFPQGTYRFSCDALGEIEIFITQVADGSQGSEFEAIFT
ncbi:MAG: hypothetical protein ABIS50_09610 [Luteolibacter sp.]|uniref:DUF6916 family protein n=1 Tax=Luteolibacter sp. TaxID=1962973 RepID=UPI003264609E